MQGASGTSDNRQATEDALRKAEHELNQIRGLKDDLEMQNSRLSESKHEVERRNESLRKEIDLLN